MDTGNATNSSIWMNKDELLQLDKETLIEKIISQQQHIKQLKDLLAKKLKKYDSKPPVTSNKAKKEFDHRKYHQRHIFLKFLYLGWNYDGLVETEDTASTVEDHLIEALLKTKLILERQACNFQRCGRTDKGVSAFEQVVSLTVRSALKRAPGLFTPQDYSGDDDGQPIEEEEEDEDESKELNYVYLLNNVLPSTIRIMAWCPLASVTISARFDCRGRVYRYYFPRMQLDLEAMNEACAGLLGEHDFRNLCKTDTAKNVINFTRTVHRAQVTTTTSCGCTSYTMCCFEIEASAFLWHQIRCIMCLLFLVGRRLESPTIISQLLSAQEIAKGKPLYPFACDLPLVLFSTIFDAQTIPTGWIYGKDDRYLDQLLGKLNLEWLKVSTQTVVIKQMIDSIVDQLWPAATPDELQDIQAKCGDHQMFTFLSGMNNIHSYKPLLQRPRCKTLEQRMAQQTGRKKIKLMDVWLKQHSSIQLAHEPQGTFLTQSSLPLSPSLFLK